MPIDWSTKFHIERVDKATKIDNIKDMPFQCWVLVPKSALPFLFIKRAFTDNKSWLVQTWGDMPYFDAQEIMDAYGPFKIINPSRMNFKGDDRPFDDDPTTDPGDEQ